MTTTHITPYECDGLAEKPKDLPDNENTTEFQEALKEDCTELLGLFSKIIEIHAADNTDTAK